VVYETALFDVLYVGSWGIAGMHLPWVIERSRCDLALSWFSGKWKIGAVLLATRSNGIWLGIVV
jgi:hypothetical protein